MVDSYFILYVGIDIYQEFPCCFLRSATLNPESQGDCAVRMDSTTFTLRSIFQFCSPTVVMVTGWGRGRNDGGAPGALTSHLNPLPVSTASADVKEIKEKKKKDLGSEQRWELQPYFC